MSLSYSSKPVSSFNSNVQRSWTMKKKRVRRWCFLYRNVPSLLCRGLGRGEMESAPIFLFLSFFVSFLFFSFFFLFFFDYCYFLWILSGSLCEGEGGVPTIFACVADALKILYRGLYKWFRRVRRPAVTQAILSESLVRGILVWFEPTFNRPSTITSYTS